MNKRFGVDVLDTGYKLVGEEQNRFQCELSIAEVEKIFQAGTQQVHDHGIVATFRTKPTHKGNANATSEGFVGAGFIFKVRILGPDTL